MAIKRGVQSDPNMGNCLFVYSELLRLRGRSQQERLSALGRVPIINKLSLSCTIVQGRARVPEEDEGGGVCSGWRHRGSGGVRLDRGTRWLCVCNTAQSDRSSPAGHRSTWPKKRIFHGFMLSCTEGAIHVMKQRHICCLFVSHMNPRRFEVKAINAKVKEVPTNSVMMHFK